RTPARQRYPLECAMARTVAELSQTKDRPRNSRCPSFRQGRGGGVDSHICGGSRVGCAARDPGKGARPEHIRDARKPGAGKHHLLLAVPFSLEAGSKQRTSGEFAPAGCLFACKRLDSGGGSWSTQLSHKRFGRLAVPPFRIPTHIRRFRAADSAGVLL